MTYDIVIRGGRVVDGTGMPAYSADVAVKDGRIARIGRVDETADRIVEADGCIVAPGFIDVHTHYDVQLDWDPIASPSCWHGVTTVLTGNCGFTLAPAKPEDVGWLAAMLSRVEGMSKDALAAGFQFAGGSFADFWDRLDGRLGVNAGGYVGHCAVRRWVMGDDASEREATDDEIAQMKVLVREAMKQGAIGFSTSQLDLHVGDDGRGVPSNFASAAEILALASVLAEFDHGAIEIIPRSFAEAYDAKDRQLLLDLYRVSGKPIELNILLPSATHPMSWQNTLDFCTEAFQQGVRLHPQASTNTLGLHLKLSDTFVFDEMALWREVLTRPEPERSERLRDPSVRDRLQAEWEEDDPRRGVQLSWDRIEVESVNEPAHASWVGKSPVELAAEMGGRPIDAFLDVSLAEGLDNWWQARTDEVSQQFIRHVMQTAVNSDIVMSGSSDGGAHLASFVGCDYTTKLLTDWTPDPVSLERAVWQLTGMPATVHGLKDRGFLRSGAWADVVVWDPARLGSGTPYLAKDFPADTERYVIDSEGYVATLVNGEVVIENNAHTGALSGHVIRGC